MSGRWRQSGARAGRSVRPEIAGLRLFTGIGVAALILTGCQAPQGNLKSSNVAAVAAPMPLQANPSPIIAMPAVVHSDPASPSVRLTGDPKELVGLDHAAVRRVLGDPVRIRNERPAEVWQYATGDCIVDLYLYNFDGTMKVTFVEARSHTAETAPTTRCLKSLLERPTASAS